MQGFRRIRYNHWWGTVRPGWGLAVGGILLLLRGWFWFGAFPNPDEAYYWLWGQHPGLSYFDHPPFHAWVQGLTAALLGRSTFALRLPNLVSNGLLLYTYWRICRYLYGTKALDRWWLVVLLLLSSPLFFLFLALAWNDHWLVTFAVMGSFAFVQFLDSYRLDRLGRTDKLLAAAIWLGLAGLCKYTALLIALAFLATIVSDRYLRPLLWDRRLYAALAVALLILSPILIWNYQHDFFSFRFYLERSASDRVFTFTPFQPLVFLLLCSLILGPIHSWAIIQCLRRRYQRTDASQAEVPSGNALPMSAAPSYYPSLAWWLFGLSTGGFTLLSLGSVAIYYWNILAYPLLFPLMADWFLGSSGGKTSSVPKQRSLQAPKLRHPRSLIMAEALGLVAAVGLVFHYTIIPITALVGPAADRDSAALYGWPAIAKAIEAQTQSLADPLLLTTDYRSAAALAYQLNRPDVIALSGRIDQFDFWYDATTMAGRDVVLLAETWHPICPQHREMLTRSTVIEELIVKRFQRSLQTYTILSGSGFQSRAEASHPLSPTYPLAYSSDGEICQ